MMGIFCDRLKLGSTAGLECQIGQNKGRYLKKQLLLLLVLLMKTIRFFQNPIMRNQWSKSWINRSCDDNATLN